MTPTRESCFPFYKHRPEYTQAEAESIKSGMIKASVGPLRLPKLLGIGWHTELYV